MTFVYDPKGITFNGHVYAFLRSWYCPELEGVTFEGDTWFKVAAVRSSNGSYSVINSKIEMTSLMMIGDNSRMLRSARMRTDLLVPDEEMMRVRQTAFDIPTWEMNNQQSFPYDRMFTPGDVNRRYQAINGVDGSAFFSTQSQEKLFTHIQKKLAPKPCTTCGRKK